MDCAKCAAFWESGAGNLDTPPDNSINPALLARSVDPVGRTIATPSDSPGRDYRTTHRDVHVLLSRTLTQGDEQLVQLIERLDHCFGGSAGSVERFL